MGIFVGISAAIVPAYIKGVIPKEVAGSSGTFNQLLQTLGVLVCYILGFFCMRLT